MFQCCRLFCLRRRSWHVSCLRLCLPQSVTVANAWRRNVERKEWPKLIPAVRPRQSRIICLQSRVRRQTLAQGIRHWFLYTRYRRFRQLQRCRNLDLHPPGQLTSTRLPSHLQSLFPFLESDRLSSQLLTHWCVCTFVRLQTYVCDAEERCNPLICPEVSSGAFVFH